MRLVPTLVLALGAPVLTMGCAPGELPPLGEIVSAEQPPDGDDQGTLSQGTLSQGTLSQGTNNQGSRHAINVFDLRTLKYGSWSLTSKRVDKGRIAADWGSNSDSCGPS